MTATVLAPDWRSTSRVTLGWPLSRASERSSLVPSSAQPMSRTRMGEPLRVATTRSLKARASASRPMVRRVCSRWSVVTLPPGTLAFWRSTASRTAVMGIW